MAKLDPRRLPRKYRDELEWTFLAALHRLGLNRKSQKLLRGLLTDGEVIMLARRMKVADRLLGGMPFEEIKRELHVGLATIRFVHQFLEDDFDTMRSLVTSLQHERAKKKNRSLKKGTYWEIDPQSFDGLRARYPQYFPILNFFLGDPREKHEPDEEGFFSQQD